MILLPELIPIFLVSNLHCLGMCGPLMLLMSRNPYSTWYVIGRNVSFALTGLLCGYLHTLSFGAYLSIYVTVALDITMLTLLGMIAISPWVSFYQVLPVDGLIRRIQPLFQQISHHASAKTLATMGFLSILIPCSQTIAVFSTIALVATPITGFINGAFFGFITSPALIFVQLIYRYLHQYSHITSVINRTTYLIVFLYLLVKKIMFYNLIAI
ncbi:sulfite exporter TauE/SafE family protein [Chlamydiia bacterium]|jgi:uncharacterized protein|nr:sulfite exporter TauE/SafE family protein [Chlamydiia bacterium]